MKKSIFLKIFISYLFVILIFSVLVDLLVFKTIKSFHIEYLTNELEGMAIALRFEVTPLLKEKQYGELDRIVKKLGKDIQKRITVIDPEGVVRADSEKNPKLMENHKNRPEVKQALIRETGERIRFSSTVEEEMLYVAIPVVEQDKLIGIVRVSLFLREINEFLGSIRSKIVEITLVLIAISILIAIIFSKRLSDPIKKLSDGAKEVASGDFDTKVILKGDDELRELSESFNYMTEKIKSLFIDLSFQKEEINSVVSSIQESIMVLDEKGKIVFCNDSLKKVLQNDSIEGKYYWEFLRDPNLDQTIKSVNTDKRNLITEIELNDKIFLCSITFITPKNQIVLLLHNITEVKKLEQVKKDFVVNVSHELKTPMTAIKGFVETLKEEVQPKQKRYLDIIERHSNRLIKILDDLLLLSKLEETRVKLELERVNLKVLLDNVVKIFQQKLKEKNLELSVNIEENIPTIKADAYKLEQMLINLIDNAIKYTEKGGIEIALSSDDGMIKIGIKDTGIGIINEHQNRIFERFYVVDKSRSRNLGGTGLGLSIVKHIVLLHNGKIDVKSTSGVGSEFIVTIPVNTS